MAGSLLATFRCFVSFYLVFVVKVSSTYLEQHKSVSLGGFSVWPSNRTLCQLDAEYPQNRINTTDRLRLLRHEMTVSGVDAYLIVMTDEHGSYSGTGIGYDARVAHISGFTGSYGWAVVTMNQSALWTDDRYFVQADQQMDCNWILMRLDQVGYPQTSWDWLRDAVPRGSKLGAYPKIVSRVTWQSYESNLAPDGITVEPVDRDLIDLIWTNGRPLRSNNHLIIHDESFAGESWSRKLSRVRQVMADNDINILLVTLLEQVAWLFNLRGSDKSFSLFYTFAIVYEEKASLFVRNHTALMTTAIQAHLDITMTGSCWNPTSMNCVNVHEFDDLYDHIEAFQRDNTVWIDPTANQAIYSAASASGTKLYSVTSPIELIKSIKNQVERQRFAECIVRDSAAVIEFVALLEKEIKGGRGNWTELSASQKLGTIRANYTNYQGPSFTTISAFGANAAVIHYRPEAETDTTIDDSNVYLLDSGGQYLDGTTDVTRTFHYGTPSDMIKEAYTRILMGQIDLAQTVWPEGMYGYELDIRARAALHQYGWDFKHVSGHGIGYFLSVSEGPSRIDKGYNPSQEPLYEGMFLSDEPGFYEDNNFGIRLENLVTVVQANTTNNFGQKKYVTFRTLTLIPYEHTMIKYELLSKQQKSWLNDYNRQCLERVGRYLLDVRHNEEAYEWIVARTAAIDDGSSTTSPPSRCSAITSGFSTLLVSMVTASLLLTL